MDWHITIAPRGEKCIECAKQADGWSPWLWHLIDHSSCLVYVCSVECGFAYTNTIVRKEVRADSH